MRKRRGSRRCRLPKVVDHEARRRDILDGAFGVFAERGYGSVSMRQLAQSLGFSTGTLYHYFQGKEALFEALVDHRARLDVAEATAGFDTARDANAKLFQLASFVTLQQARLADTLSIALDYARHEPDTAILARVLDGYRTALTEALGPTGGDLALSLLLGLLAQRLLHAEPDLSAHLAALVRLR